MNTYLMPISDGNDTWIESVHAGTFVEAETKFVKFLADDYAWIDYGDSIADASDVLRNHDIVLGDIYDIEEF